jgi:type IV pilus assembly protein PilA
MKLTLILTLKNRLSRGFTLMELMVVMLFISIFAVVALPNLIKQAGKAREVEFKNTVGTVNRAQQAYHWEKKTFAEGDDDLRSLELLNVSFESRYITDYNIFAYSDPIAHATIAPSNEDYQRDQTRSYSGLTTFDQGVYATFICQSYLVSEITDPPNLPPNPVCNEDAQELR